MGKPTRRAEDYETLEKLRFLIVEDMKAGLSTLGHHRGATTHVAKQVAEKRGVSVSTVMRTWKNYKEKGEDGIKAKPIPGPPQRLTPEQVKKLIQVAFKQPPPRGYRWWTNRLMQKEARTRFGVKCDPATIHRAMVKKGWSLLKVRRRLHEKQFRARLGKCSPSVAPRSRPAAKPIATKTPSPGKVLMALGARGYCFDQAKRYAAAKKLKVKDKSIHTYLSMGRTGKRGKPAKLTAEQWAEVKKLAGPKTPWPKTVKSTIY